MSATGMKGGHILLVHYQIVYDAMQQAEDSGLIVKGQNAHNSCNRTFKGCLNLGDGALLRDEDTETLQKIIPDGNLNALNVGNLGPLTTSNRLHKKEALVEAKTLSHSAMTPNARAAKFDRSSIARATKLDADYPGSTFRPVLRSFGVDGKYLVLVAGPFAKPFG